MKFLRLLCLLPVVFAALTASPDALARRGFGVIVEGNPTAPPVAPPPVNPSTFFVVTSDPQYPWTPRDDGTGPAVDDPAAQSRALIEQQYDSINAFSAGGNVLATFINGDLTAFGHHDQVNHMRWAIGTLRQPVYLGLGNHDYENNLNDCSFEENNCLRRSVYWFAEHMSKLPLDSFDMEFRSYYEFPSNHEEVYGSLGWAKTFGNVVVLQVNNHADYAVWASGWSAGRALKEIVNVRPALRWLDGQMSRARQQGKAIVLMMHKPQVSPALAALIDRYEVSAVFAGHFHTRLGQGGTVGSTQVPVYFSGSASQRSYLIVEDVEGMGTHWQVHRVRENNPMQRAPIGTIPLKRPVAHLAPADYPLTVRIHNQGGYEGGYWLRYRVGSQWTNLSAFLQNGKAHTFEVPGGARDIHLDTASYTGVVWDKWRYAFQGSLQHDRDHCISTWGTSLHPAWGYCR